MRLWTLHPRYLDSKGLVAAWREALLAQKVLLGATRGYRNHPQLARFRALKDPHAAIAAFLHELAVEAARRGYRFDTTKIVAVRAGRKMRETRGQMAFEWAHLLRKLEVRAPELARRWRKIAAPEAHPLFRLIEGDVRAWEKQPESAAKTKVRPATADTRKVARSSRTGAVRTRRSEKAL